MVKTMKHTPAAVCSWERSLQCRRPEFDPWVGKIPLRREWQHSPVFLPGEFHGQRSLAGYSPWGCKDWDMTERLILSLLFCLPSQDDLTKKSLKNHLCHVRVQATRNRTSPDVRCLCSAHSPGKAVSEYGACLQGERGCLACLMGHCSLPWPPACKVATVFRHLYFPLCGKVIMASIPCGCYHFAWPWIEAEIFHKILFFQGNCWGRGLWWGFESVFEARLVEVQQPFRICKMLNCAPAITAECGCHVK